MSAVRLLHRFAGKADGLLSLTDGIAMTNLKNYRVLVSLILGTTLALGWQPALCEKKITKTTGRRPTIPLNRVYRENHQAPGPGALLQATVGWRHVGNVRTGFLSAAEWEMLRENTLHLLKKFPNHCILAPGRSGTPITTLCKILNPELALNIPISGLKAGQIPNDAQWDLLFDRFLLPYIQKYPQTPFLVIDRSSSGTSMKEFNPALDNYLRRRGFSNKVKSCSFDRHPELEGQFDHRVDVTGLSGQDCNGLPFCGMEWMNVIGETYSEFPSFHALKENVNGVRARPEYAKYYNAMLQRAVTDPMLDDAIVRFNKKYNPPEDE